MSGEPVQRRRSGPIFYPLSQAESVNMRVVVNADWPTSTTQSRRGDIDSLSEYFRSMSSPGSCSVSFPFLVSIIAAELSFFCIYYAVIAKVSESHAKQLHELHGCI